jgi:hypothetical protein
MHEGADPGTIERGLDASRLRDHHACRENKLSRD